MNVSVAFDEASGRPIYRLRYGHPGTSNALQIAADLGMGAEIIEVAKRHLDKDEGCTIELIRKLEEACLKAEAEGEELKYHRQQLEDIQAGLVRDHEQLVQSREGILEQARQQSDALLAEAEREIKSAISHLQQGGMREAMATQKKVQQIREGLNSVLESPSQERGDVLTTPVAEGKLVRLRGVSGSGILLRLKDQGRRAEVQMGEKRVEVDTEALESLPTPRGRLGGAVPGNGIRLFREPHETCYQRLHLVGLRVEEALPLLDKAIDQALLEGSSEIQVVHGHGTGRLRQAVQDFLAEHAVVKGFHLEHQSRGGSGVTVVELKD
jgi:DNA mismatch repair protein MutS2